jgi:hypothetical protein
MPERAVVLPKGSIDDVAFVEAIFADSVRGRQIWKSLAVMSNSVPAIGWLASFLRPRHRFCYRDEWGPSWGRTIDRAIHFSYSRHGGQYAPYEGGPSALSRLGTSKESLKRLISVGPV